MFSLLYPTDTEPKYNTLSPESINDLSIDYLCDNLTEDTQEKTYIKNILIKISNDPLVIQYRLDVFSDISENPELREKLKEILEQLDFLKTYIAPKVSTEASSLWELVNRSRELDSYIQCIEAMKACLGSQQLKSQGLKNLKKYVDDIYISSGFEALKKDIKILIDQIGEVKSLTLGVNLNKDLLPSEVGILSINNDYFGQAGILSSFVSYHKDNNTFGSAENYNGMTRFKQVGKVAGENGLMNPLNRAVGDLLKTMVRDLKNTLRKYTDISGYALVKLLPEVVYYLRFTTLTEKIKMQNIPICKPQVIKTEAREFFCQDLYNYKLAIKRTKGEKFDIITNDLTFDSTMRIYILTGPNRGGKTTFTQAVGLVLLLFHAGIYVPAKSAKISPVDNIFTHFPADENTTVELGRLGEESKRLNYIFSEATNQSLLLLNESLATTTFTEGLFIAKDVVRSLRYLGARTIFNTHMHELAADCESLNKETTGDSVIASLVTGIESSTGTRSFKVYVAPPKGISYASDIAKKYGVTFEQLKKQIDQNQ